MNLIIKLKHNNLFESKLFVLILILFVVCSYQKIILVDFLDDIFIIFMGIFYLIRLILKKLIKKNLLIYYFILFFYGINSIINHSISDLFILLKICIILFFCFETYFTTSDNKTKGLQLLLFISIPNVICGFYQYFKTYIQGVYISGKYDMTLGYRLQGFLGHPIPYSLLILAVLIILLFFVKKWYIQFIGMIISVFLIKYTASDFAYALALLCIGMKCMVILFNKLMKLRIKRKIIVSITITMIFFGSIFLLYKMSGEMNTIRYVSAIGVIRNINLVSFIVGHGIGAFRNSNYQEIYLFKVFYDMGIVGLGMLFHIFYSIIKENLKSGSYEGIAILTILLLNMVINDGYMIPFIIMVPIFCSKIKPSPACISNK